MRLPVLCAHVFIGPNLDQRYTVISFCGIPAAHSVWLQLICIIRENKHSGLLLAVMNLSARLARHVAFVSFDSVTHKHRTRTVKGKIKQILYVFLWLSGGKIRMHC